MLRSRGRGGRGVRRRRVGDGELEQEQGLYPFPPCLGFPRPSVSLLGAGWQSAGKTTFVNVIAVRPPAPSPRRAGLSGSPPGVEARGLPRPRGPGGARPGRDGTKGAGGGGQGTRPRPGTGGSEGVTRPEEPPPAERALLPHRSRAHDGAKVQGLLRGGSRDAMPCGLGRGPGGPSPTPGG